MFTQGVESKSRRCVAVDPVTRRRFRRRHRRRDRRRRNQSVNIRHNSEERRSPDPAIAAVLFCCRCSR